MSELDGAQLRISAGWTRPAPELVAEFARFQVANLGDAMERLGICDSGISPIWPGAKFVGTALPILTTAGDNAAIIKSQEFIQPGDVVMVNGAGHLGRALIGDNLVQRFAARGAAGAVVDGCVRDRETIENLGFPVFARGVTPAGPFKNGPGVIGEDVAIGGVVFHPGDIVCADSDGIIVIPPARAREVLDAVLAVVAREEALDAEVAAATFS
ncbi:methyltransferase [Rhodococcus jostii]|uniref:Putative 4-hydroxy-4-methyl-2-oxoglutarate aldolase n=1 Tax=Rhodococcus jostii TaxID=132919 RepID=A0A1H5H521_RHOJO|nr:methyltransferase [Rhodococcus jostii]SEE23020.1 Regulator of RNase E activity RraA [Rhodococcus jostii]